MDFTNWKKQSHGMQSIAKTAKQYFFDDAVCLPLVYRPTIPHLSLSQWYPSYRTEIENNLLRYGAILFRGFDIQQQHDFSQFVDVAIKQKLQYLEGATPRTELGDSIYTSTEFPPDEEIALHNELSYFLTPPDRLVFCCLKASIQGGQTQLADVRRVHDRIDPALREQFRLHAGWALQRNYGNGLGPVWQKAFALNTLEQLQEYCQHANMELEVFDEQHIRTYQVRDAVHRHPLTEECIWFNHATFWHPSSLCPEVRAGLDQQFSIQEYPYCTFFGDGTEISDQQTAEVRRAYQQEEILFDWHDGDVLLIDNRLVAHGRKPYSGERQVLVAMGQIE